MEKPELVPLKEFADELAVSKQRVRKLLSMLDLPLIRLGRMGYLNQEMIRIVLDYRARPQFAGYTSLAGLVRYWELSYAELLSQVQQLGLETHELLPSLHFLKKQDYYILRDHLRQLRSQYV